MTGYWTSSFFRVYGPKRTQKKNEAVIKDVNIVHRGVR